MKTRNYRLAAISALMAGTTFAMMAGTPLNLTDSKQSLEKFSGQDVTVSGKSEIHLTGKTPMENSTVELKGADAWLYIDNVKPTLVQKNYLANIKVDGQAAEHGKTVRLAQWAGGTVVIPYGTDSYKDALTVYSGKDQTGESKTFEIETYHKDLGTFDNNIRSIKLKKGFMATLANNPDGTGFSKCFIASDEDLLVNLPEGFVTEDKDNKSFVSFIRVFKWEWVSKKGWAGSDHDLMDLLNVTSYYGWDAGGATDRIDHEYSPQRHHIGWPGFDQISGKTGVTHILGNNEPDNKNDPKEHPAEPIEVIREWPEYMKTGLRAGSPAPTSIWGSWLTDFFNLADKYNYRVDFVVFHMYEATTDFAGRVNKAYEVSKGRPVWITEWNNGANWTTETWPTSDRSASEANQNKQLEYMKEALKNQDALDKLERLHFYNWVQDARAVALGSGSTATLTKAGEYFRDYNSKVAFSKSTEYDHKWKIAPPLLSQSWSDDFKSVKLSWYDHNGETGLNYIVERKNDNGSYETIATLELGKDYQAGETVNFEDKVTCASQAKYRVKATSYTGKPSVSSDVITIERDIISEAPALSGIAEDMTSVKLTWPNVKGAKAYRIERADALDGEYKVLGTTTGYKYSDSKLAQSTVYYYRLAVLSNADEEPVSAPVRVRTPSLSEAPDAVIDLFAGCGDKSVSLSWAKTYRTTWEVERADSPDGPFVKVSGDKQLSATSFTDENVQNDITYYYRLIPYRFELKGNPSAVVQATPKQGNVVYYPFNEGTDAPRDLYSANTATLKNGTYWTENRNGEPNQALQLDANLEKSHIVLQKDIVKNLSDFTISIWVKPGSVNGRIFDFGSSTTKFMILNYEGSGKYRYKITSDKGTFQTDNLNFTGSTLKKGEWYNLTLTQAGKTLKFYVNGKLEKTMSGALAPSTMGSTTNNMLGQSQWEADPLTDFAFDDLYIYNYCMDDAAVAELANRTTLTEVEELAAEGVDGLSVAVVDGNVVIKSTVSESVNIYSADGALVRVVAVMPGVTVVEGLGNGIYVVDGKKVIL